MIKIRFHKPGTETVDLVTYPPHIGETIRLGGKLYRIHDVEWTPEADSFDAYVVLR
jgi:hypothetical protein